MIERLPWKKGWEFCDEMIQLSERLQSRNRIQLNPAISHNGLIEHGETRNPAISTNFISVSDGMCSLTTDLREF